MTTTLLPPIEITAARIPIAGHRWIAATVAVPAEAKGVVVFAHGGRSPDDQLVAAELHDRRLATVLADLLTLEEQRIDERTAALRFQVPLLAQRVVDVINWAQTSGAIAGLPLGLFGAGATAAAALDAAAQRPREIAAVVARNARVDLAASLEDVTAPTLLIAGGNDPVIVALNERAVRRMDGMATLRILPEKVDVATLASRWFIEHLVAEDICAFAMS